MIPLFKVFMSDKVDKPLLETLYSGYIGQGPKVEEFEAVLKNYFGQKYLITTNSGTSALHLALDMLPSAFGNDTVLASPLTCFASNAPIIKNRFNLKWVDIDPKTLNMDLDDMARKVDKDVRAVVLPYWGGCPVNPIRLNTILKDLKDKFGFKIVIIEDAAHAFGAEWGDQKVGTFGHFTMFSFQAIKHLTTVDGGLLICPNKNTYKRAKLLRWYGMDRETDKEDFRCEADVEEAGFKFHMNDISATIGLINFKHINWILEVHRSNAAFYNQELKNVNGIKLLEYSPYAKSSYWLYTLLVDKRTDFMKKMESDGIQVSRVHERNDKYSCAFYYRTMLPNLERVIKHIICIPVGWWVTDEDREYIVKKIKEGW